MTVKLRIKPFRTENIFLAFFILTSVTVLIVAFAVFVNPFEERRKNIDQDSIDIVRDIAEAINNDFGDKTRDLRRSIDSFNMDEYEGFQLKYKSTSEYDICTEFLTEEYDLYRDELQHGAGYECIEVSAYEDWY